MMNLAMDMTEQKKIFRHEERNNSYKKANLKREDSITSMKSDYSYTSKQSRTDDQYQQYQIQQKQDNRLKSKTGQKYSIGNINSPFDEELNQINQTMNNQIQAVENSYISKKTNESDQDKTFHLNIADISKNLQTSSIVDTQSKYKINSECTSKISVRSQPKSIQKSQRSVIRDQVSTQTKKNVKDQSQISNNNDQFKLNMLFKVKSKFRQFYQRQTIFGRSKAANQSMKAFIKDMSDVDSEGKSHYFSNIYACLRQYLMSVYHMYRQSFFSSLPSFHPQNSWYLWFSALFCMSNYLFFFILSIILIYLHGEEVVGFADRIYTIIQIQWAAEILIKLNTGIFQQTSYISRRKTIITIYFKERLVFDAVPFFGILTHSENIYFFYFLRFLLFMKIVNVYSDHMNIEKYLIVKMKNFYVLQMINLVSKLFLIGHVIACLYYLLALIDLRYFDSEETSWINDGITVPDRIWWKVYIKSFYWSFTLMTTGSNEAHTVLEIFFTSIIMLLICIIYGYMLNTIGIILTDINKNEENQRRDINTINTYMQRKNISIHLQRMVNLDLENFYLRSIKQKSSDELCVLDKISTDLNDSLKLEYNKNIISKIKYLVDNFSQEVIEQISLKAEEVYYSPNQVIFAEDETNNSSLMFIVDGKVGLFQKYKKSDTKQIKNMKFLTIDWSKKQKRDQEQKLLCTLGSGTSFGELNFFTGMARQTSAVSEDFTTILMIDREDFINIVKKHEDDFEKFCYMKDRIFLYDDFEPINKKCNVCENQYHLDNQCPIVHFDKKNPYIFIRFQFSEKQERNQDQVDRYKRKKTYNALVYINQVSDAIERIWELVEDKASNDDEQSKESGENQSDDDSKDSSFNKESQFYLDLENKKEDPTAMNSEQDGIYQSQIHGSQLNADEVSKSKEEPSSILNNKSMVKIKENTIIPLRTTIQRQSVNQQMIERTKTMLFNQNPDLLKATKVNENIMWYSEQMKVFTHYFPDGNYSNRINRYNIMKNRYLKKKYGRNNYNERTKSYFKSDKQVTRKAD